MHNGLECSCGPHRDGKHMDSARLLAVSFSRLFGRHRSEDLDPTSDDSGQTSVLKARLTVHKNA